MINEGFDGDAKEGGHLGTDRRRRNFAVFLVIDHGPLGAADVVGHVLLGHSFGFAKPSEPFTEVGRAGRGRLGHGVDARRGGPSVCDTMHGCH